MRIDPAEIERILALMNSFVPQVDASIAAIGALVTIVKKALPHGTDFRPIEESLARMQAARNETTSLIANWNAAHQVNPTAPAGPPDVTPEPPPIVDAGPRGD